MLGFHAVSEAPLSHAAAGVAAEASYVDGAVEFGREPIIIPRGGLSRNRKPELPRLNLAQPMSDGLVSALALYEGAGNVAHDVSSYNNDAQIYHWDFAGRAMEPGAPNWEVDINGPLAERCLRLNSPDSSTPNDITVIEQTGKAVDALDGSNSWSIVWWQKLAGSESGSGRKGCIFHNGWNHTAYSGLDKSILIFVSGGKIEVDHIGEINTYSDASLTFDEWQQIAVTYDGSTERVYINGVEKDSASVGALDLDSSTLRWGNDSFSGLNPTHMRLKSTLIYQKSLSASQIKELYINPYSIYRSSPPIIPDIFNVPKTTMEIDSEIKIGGASSISSSASLSGDEKLTLGSAVNLSSVATATFKGPAKLKGVVVSTGPATVGVTGSIITGSVVSISGTAALSSDAHLKLKGAQSFTGSVQLLDPNATVANLRTAGVASISGSSSVAADGSLRLAAIQSISTQGTLSVDGRPVQKGGLNLSSSATLSANGTSMPTGVGILTGPSTLSTNGSVKVAGKLSTSSSSTLSSAGYSSVQAAVSVTGQGTLTTKASLSVAGGVSPSGVATKTTVGRMTLRGILSINQFGAFNQEFSDAFDLSASRLGAHGSQTMWANPVSFSSSASMSIGEGIKLKAVSILTGPSTVAANGSVLRTVAVSVSGAGTLSVAGVRLRTTTVALSNQASAVLNGVLYTGGKTTIESAATVSGRGAQTLRGKLDISGSSTVTAVPVMFLPDNVLITLYINQVESLEGFINQNKALDGYIFQQMNTDLNIDSQLSTSRYIDRELSVGLER